MNLIFTLAIAISLTGASAASSLRGVADMFEDQVAVALGGHKKQNCVDNCEEWWGVSKQSCQDCCEQGKQRTGDWTCNPQTLGGMCGAHCNNDGGCQTGGLIICGKCADGGTRYANTCIADNETPETTPAPVEPVGTGCGGQRMPQCGSGQGGTRQMMPMCCPNDSGSFQYDCVYVGQSCPAPTPAPVEPVGTGCGGQRMPQCGSGQGGTRQMMPMCCPNDSGSFEYDCVYLGEDCPSPTPVPAPWEYPGGQGGQCGLGCGDDDDCWTGGLVTCGTCNKLHGTEGYDTCINPPAPGGDLEDEEFGTKE